jgi:hypothetical protein
MLRRELLGFSDFFDEVGAVKPPGKPARTKPAQGKPPTGKSTGTVPPPTARTYSPPKKTTGMKKHGLVLKKAKATLLKAARGLGRAQMLLAKRPSPAAKAQAATAMRTAATKATVARQAAVQAQRTPTPTTQRAAVLTRGAAAKSILGAVEAMVGAQKPVPSVVTTKMTAKQKAAVAKHNAALEAAKKAAQNLAKNTIKAKQSVQKLAKAAINQKKVAKALRTKRTGRTAVGDLMGHHLIGEEVAEALGEYYETVGAAPDPMNPGFLDDGSPDPAFSMEGGGESLLSQEDLSALSAEDDSADTLDIINATKDLAPMPLNQATEADYRSIGGVLYNESKGRPNGFIGSYGLMMRETDKKNAWGVDSTESEGTDHFGYVWGQYEADGPEKGVRWGKELTPNAWNYIHGARTVTDKHGWANKVDEAEVLASVGKNAPSGKPFGPIIGNPALVDFKGLRMDAQGNLFWYPQEAPDWVTAPLKQAAAITEALEKKAAEDEAKQYALEQEKLRRDEAAAQAAQDAANALAESAAVSEAKIAEQQEGTKQMQAETEAQQSLVQAQQQETQQAAAEAATEQQAQQLLLQRAQRQEQLLAETPELEAALMLQDAGLLEEGAENEEGSGEEEEPSYDDTTAYSEPEAESDKFRHPLQDDDYEASGFEDDSSDEF